MRFLPFLLAFPVLVGCSGPAGNTQVEAVNQREPVVERKISITEEIRSAILGIESNAILPQGAFEKTRYWRYYGHNNTDDKQILTAVWMFRESYQSDPEKQYPIKNLENAFYVHTGYLPRVVGGKCKVISFSYDLSAAKMIPDKIVYIDPKTGDERSTDVHGRCNGLR